MRTRLAADSARCRLVSGSGPDGPRDRDLTRS